ncbi:MAG: sensor histidine kinase [Oscillospiraceae bacterium]
MKCINQLMLWKISKKKTFADKVYYWHLKLDGIFVIVTLLIVLITNTYHMTFKDTFVLITVLMLLSYVIISVIDNYQLKKFFAPLKDLVNFADKISNGRDLSKRLTFYKDGNQNAEIEIIRFSKTFNRMFDRLEQSFNYEKQFARDISHEIKTPLAVIVSNCEYAIDFTDDPEEMFETLNTIKDEANKISGITSKLSALSKMDGTNANLDYEDFCINELIELTIDELSIEYQDKNVTINLIADENINVHADRIMMVRLFMNLISNSIKYGNQDGITNVSIKRDGKNLICSVSDNGIGISHENIENIWQPFFRVNRTMENSTGLGLPMVKKIVNLHGGHIYVVSQLGEGTEFNLKMPIIQD